MTHRSLLNALMIGVATLSLSACASTAHKVSEGKTQSPYDAKINAALERAAGQAQRSGQAGGSLALMERLYKRDPKNPENAVKFASALKENGAGEKALAVLEPFTRSKDASADLITELASLQLALGKNAAAEQSARSAITKDADTFRAYQVLGISLDAQGKYKAAEEAFRKGLDMWKGDPIPIMNNLALNLTNQERLPEALEIMERAKEAAPDRVEVERNLRIIRTLNESADGRPAPKPSEKPGARPVNLAPSSDKSDN